MKCTPRFRLTPPRPLRNDFSVMAARMTMPEPFKKRAPRFPEREGWARNETYSEALKEYVIKSCGARYERVGAQRHVSRFMGLDERSRLGV